MVSQLTLNYDHSVSDRRPGYDQFNSAVDEAANLGIEHS